MKRSIVVLLATLLAAGAAQALDHPTPVSPGSTSTVTRIADQCPTFSWASPDRVGSFELVVYSLAKGQTAGAAAGEEPMYRVTVPGSASGWTPSLDLCLKESGRYAWSIRAQGTKTASEWSTPSLFEVVATPGPQELDEALSVVRRYLQGQEEAAAVMLGGALAGLADPNVAAGAIGAPTPNALGGSDFSVDNQGNVAGEEAIFAGDFGFGGNFFNGNPTGYFLLGFLGNNSNSCNTICGNHAGVCRFAVDLTNFSATLCNTTQGDVTLALCMCSTS